MKCNDDIRNKIRQQFQNEAEAFIQQIERGYIQADDVAALSDYTGHLRKQGDRTRTERNEACSEVKDSRMKTAKDIRREMFNLIRGITEEKFQQVYIRLLLTNEKGSYLSINEIGKMYYDGASRFKYWLAQFKEQYPTQWKLVREARATITKADTADRVSIKNATQHNPNRDTRSTEDASDKLENYLKLIEAKHGAKIADLVSYAVENFGKI